MLFGLGQPHLQVVSPVGLHQGLLLALPDELFKASQRLFRESPQPSQEAVFLGTCEGLVVGEDVGVGPLFGHTHAVDKVNYNWVG